MPAFGLGGSFYPVLMKISNPLQIYVSLNDFTGSIMK